jgi:hypothetical protein
MRTTSAVRLTISFRLCQPFFEGSKEQATAKGKGQRRQRGTEWACLVFSDRWVMRDDEKLSAFVELERQGRFISNQFMPIRYAGTEYLIPAEFARTVRMSVACDRQTRRTLKTWSEARKILTLESNHPC